LILSRNLRLEGFLRQSCPDSVPNPLISRGFNLTLWHVFGNIPRGWPDVIDHRVEHSQSANWVRKKKLWRFRKPMTLEQSFYVEVEKRRSQLALACAALEERNGKFQGARPEIMALREPISHLEGDKINIDAVALRRKPRTVAKQSGTLKRRWQTGRPWKRRWKLSS
jgi:hypothetical protein